MTTAELLRQFTGREAHPVVQFIKYAIGGVIATAADVTIFYLAAILLLPALTPDDPAARLLGLHPALISESLRSTHYVLDKVISFLVANQVAYVVNVLWVFTPGRHSKLVEFLLFNAVSIVSFGVGTGIAWLLIKAVGMPTTYAYIVNMFASLAINYACRKYLVFKG